MGIGDRVREAFSGDSPEEADDGAVEGPAAAGGFVKTDRSPTSDGEGQVSAGGSGTDDLETSAGGADAVPDTPDGVVEDYT